MHNFEIKNKFIAFNKMNRREYWVLFQYKADMEPTS